MLLFILLQNDRKNRQILFQYISCYSLSIGTAKKIEAKRVFQYISCYSLSKYDFWIARYPAKFQYISCYSLSFQRDHLHFQIQRFQYISCYSLSGTTRTEVSPYRSFNTSHVTLYLYSSPNNVGSSGVSIHLMLLFIAIRHWKEQHLLGFNTSHVTLYP